MRRTHLIISICIAMFCLGLTAETLAAANKKTMACNGSGQERITRMSKPACVVRQIPGYDISGDYTYEACGRTLIVRLRPDGTGSWDYECGMTRDMQWGILVKDDGSPIVEKGPGGEAHVFVSKTAGSTDWQGLQFGISYTEKKMIIGGERVKRIE